MGSTKSRIKEFLGEWAARRHGRQSMEKSGISRTVRDVTGPIGNAHSRSWDLARDKTKQYNHSFDPRIPPSLFVSERDRQRAGQVMPISERCIEDWPNQHGE